jgi:DNA-binding response OmpR family regulator
MAAKIKILFVDDNPTDRAFVAKILTKNDFNVLLAEDGAQGLKMIREEKPDLIILDILLPHISGIELCKKIKENPDSQKIPVIFYTSLDSPKDMINYTSYGAQDYFPKTMPPEELVDEIKAILKF